MGIFLRIIIGIYLTWKILHIIIYKCKVTFGDPHTYAKMKWKTIKKLYPINPKKWDYDFGRYGGLDEFPVRILYYDKTPIMLSTIDFIRFRIAYRIHARSYGFGTDNYEALEDIIEDVQKDIDKQREQAQKEINTAIKEMKGVAK